jgi:hypothetical protein
VRETVLAAAFPSTAAGSMYELTNWLCKAPALSYNVNLPWSGSAMVQDILSSSQILTNAEQGYIGVTAQGGKYTADPTVFQNILANPQKCLGTSNIPTDFGTTTDTQNYYYDPSSSPITAATVMQKSVTKFIGNGLIFSSMDSSEADFYGLFPANLQNAAGQFVAPTQSAIDAALSDATANPDGTINANFNNTGDAAAYPLPMITYALVSTSAQPPGQAAQLKGMLTNLVNYSHTAGAGSSKPLPAGYIQLPDNIYQQALTDITNDINGPGGSNSSGAGGNGNGSSAALGGSNGVGPVGLLSSLAHRLGTGASGGAGANSENPGAGGGSGALSGHLISVTVGAERYFVPLLLLLALLCLIAGPLIYMYPSWRNSRNAAAALAADGANAAEAIEGDAGSGGDP